MGFCQDWKQICFKNGKSLRAETGNNDLLPKYIWIILNDYFKCSVNTHKGQFSNGIKKVSIYLFFLLFQLVDKKKHIRIRFWPQNIYMKTRAYFTDLNIYDLKKSLLPVFPPPSFSLYNWPSISEVVHQRTVYTWKILYTDDFILIIT